MFEKSCELAVRMASALIVIRGMSIFSTLPFSLPVAPGAQACVIEVDLGRGEARTCVVCMVHHFLQCLADWLTRCGFVQNFKTDFFEPFKLLNERLNEK